MSDPQDIGSMVEIIPSENPRSSPVTGRQAIACTGDDRAKVIAFSGALISDMTTRVAPPSVSA